MGINIDDFFNTISHEKIVKYGQIICPNLGYLEPKHFPKFKTKRIISLRDKLIYEYNIILSSAIMFNKFQYDLGNIYLKNPNLQNEQFDPRDIEIIKSQLFICQTSAPIVNGVNVLRKNEDVRIGLFKAFLSDIVDEELGLNGEEVEEINYLITENNFPCIIDTLYFVGIMMCFYSSFEFNRGKKIVVGNSQINQLIEEYPESLRQNFHLNIYENESDENLWSKIKDIFK